jgi:hypothetical protein
MLIFASLVNAFIKKMKEISKNNVKSAFSHLQRLKVDLFKLVQDMFSTFFVGYFSYDVSISISEISKTNFNEAYHPNVPHLHQRGSQNIVQNGLCLLQIFPLGYQVLPQQARTFQQN